MSSSKKTIVLSSGKIRQKLERIAYEIVEENYDEEKIFLAGLNIRGNTIAKKLMAIITSISEMEVNSFQIEVDPKDPTNVLIDANDGLHLQNQVIILVDDVANTGKTLLYSIKPFLDFIPKKIQIAVLVDRRHKRFPVSADFVGLSLSTTIQEHITVEVEDEEIREVYLM